MKSLKSHKMRCNLILNLLTLSVIPNTLFAISWRIRYLDGHTMVPLTKEMLVLWVRVESRA